MSSAIENLNQFGGQFLKFAWPMLWQSSLLIVLVLMADVLTARKIRASVRHALWLVVLAKLLLPPTLALPTGAAWWLFPAKPVVVPALQTPVANNYTVVVDDAPLPADFVSEPVPIIEPPKPKLTGAGWMLLASGVVSAGLLVWLVFRWGQLAHKVRGATKISKIVSPENMAEVFELARRRAGLRAGARLKLVEGRMSPAVCGLFRPVILLPRLLVEKLAAAQLQAVLLHEMIHLRRGDIWVNCAQSLLQIFYWWHPLVWVANARMRRVREESVDDGVMLALADEAETYAPTLLEVAKLAFRRPLLSLGLVGIMESRSALRQRIERLMDFRAPRKAGLTLVSVCGIFVFSAVAVPMGQGPARMVKEPTSNVQTTDNSADTVLLGDAFTNVSGVRIARLNADGSLDLNFTNADDALRVLRQGSGVEKLGKPEIKKQTLVAENALNTFNDIPGNPEFLAILGAQQPRNEAENLVEPELTVHSGGQNSNKSLLQELFLQGLVTVLDGRQSSNIAAIFNSRDGYASDPTPYISDSAQADQIPRYDGIIISHETFSPARPTPNATSLIVNTADPSTSSADEPKINPPQVLITGEFYQISADDFESLTAGLQFTQGTADQGEWWSGARDEFSKIQSKLKEEGLVPLNRPRILTSSGKPAQMYIGNGTNWMELDCIPTANGTNVDLKVSGEVVSRQEGVAVTNEFRMDAPVQGDGGMVVCAHTVNAPGMSNVVVVLTAKIPPLQLHIKARFISVPQNTTAGLENFLHGLNPANGQFTGILTDTNFRALLRALRSQKGVETLGEPEITTLSDRRTQMRATDMITVVTNVTIDDQGSAVPQTATFETGPVLNVTPHVLPDGYTINLKAVSALTEFLGYFPLTIPATNLLPGKTEEMRPNFQKQKLSVEANLRDNQTLVLGGFTSHVNQQHTVPKAGDVPILGRLFQADGKFVTNDVLVFITATIVDAAGSRVHAEGELAPGQSEIPEQPATTNSGGVEFSTPVPAQLPGHGAIPHGDPGGTDRLLLEGKELYERLKLKEAKAKFTEVIRLETNNATALYYLDAVKQMQTYFLPASSFSPDRGAVFLPVPNAYATNHLIFTGPGRQAIVKKLDTIHIDTVSYDSLPLNEVLKQLATQCRLHDPERKGINFLINNNPDLSAPPGSAVKVASSGPNLDPATGFLLTPAATEPPDVGSYIIKIPSLTDVRMADVLDAIELVSDHPLKYSIQDFAVVFSANSEPQLFMRTFRVDPNTFYSGLENVGALNNNAGAVVGVVNAFSGANGLRNNGGGGSQGGSGSVLKNQTDVGEANEDRNPQSLQGSSYVTAQHPASTPSALARTFFTSLGVNLVDPPGKSVFFNDRLGYLFVKATKTDLDTIEHGLQRLKPAPPPISILHLKAWFLEVPKGTLKDFGKFLNVTNPFDGRPMGILTSQNAKAALQTLQSRKGVEWTGPEVTLFSGCQAEIKSTQVEMIFTNLIVKPPHVTPQTTDLQAGSVLNARSLVLPDGHTINLSGSVSETTFYGYATKPVKQIYITNSVGIPIITNSAGELLSPPMVSPAVEIRRGSALANLYDGQTLVLSGLKPEQARFAEPNAERDAAVAKFIQEAQKKNGEKEIIVFITVNIVDPAGNRVHTDDEMPFAQDGIPPQPAGK